MNNDKQIADAYKAVIDQIITCIGAPEDTTNENIVVAVQRVVRERNFYRSMVEDSEYRPD